MTGLPNVAALLANATPGKWRSRPCNDLGRYRWVALGSKGEDTSPLKAADARLIASAPVLAAALIEAADALEFIQEYVERNSPSARSKAHFVNSVTSVTNTALARLVAFDASLKETT